MERIYTEPSALNNILKVIISKQKNTTPFIKKLNIKVKAFLVLLIFMFIVLGTQAATRTASVTGNWSSTVTWGGAAVPTASDDVIINNKTTVTLDQNGDCASLTINGFPNDTELNISSFTLNVIGNITGSTQKSILSFSSGTLNIGGSISGLSSFNRGTGTVNFKGSASSQTIPNGTYNFYNVQINNTSTSGATFSAIVTTTNLAGNLSVESGTLNNGGFAITLTTGKNFSVSNGATFNLTGTSSMVAVSGIGTKSFGATSITNYSGSTQTVSAETYGNLTLSGTGTKTISSGTSVTSNLSITGNATVAGSSSCNNLTLEPGASLLGNSLLTVSAKSEFKIKIENNNNWHLLSSPIEDHPIWPEFAPTPTGTPLSFGTGPWNWDFYYFNPNADLSTGLYWVNLRMATTGHLNTAGVDLSGNNAGFGSSPAFIAGRGYLVAYNTGWNPATGSPVLHSFSGTNPIKLFSGSSLLITRDNFSQAFNLVGNPYPSSLDWKINSGWDRSDLKLNGGYDYWIWNVSDGNYGVYNSVDIDDLGTLGVNRYIAPAQGFMVEAKDLFDGFKMEIREGARVHSTQSWIKNEVIEPGRLRLKITTSANAFSDEMIVAFNSSYTGNSGSAKFFSFYNEAPEIYSVKEGNNYSIDRYNDISTDLIVNINIKTGIDADYTITSTNIADFSLSSKVLLEDLKTGIVTDLKQTPTYSFAGAPGDDAKRFRLIIGSPIGIDEPNTTGSINIYTYENMVYVQNDKTNEPYFVTVSNMLGQTLVRTDFTGNSLNRIEMQNVPGVYVVNVVSNGKTYSQKVVIR